MSHRIGLIPALLASAVLLTVAFQAAGSEALRAAKAFDSIDDKAERSVALITEAGKVLLHPRCVNCHPSGEQPFQGDDDRIHEPPVVRSAGGFGAVGMRCGACHSKENFDPGRVPGAPNWHLAPRRMAWKDKSLAEICAQIKDPERNGGRKLAEVVRHMADDPLVAWAWEPGADREPAPGTQEVFAGLVRAWSKTGAVCPSE